MDRRKFLKITSTSSLALVVGGSGITWLAIEPSNRVLTTSSVISLIDELISSSIVSTGVWDPYSIFMHCAQSVDYSIDGYPHHKSSLFQNTVGKLAFSAFANKRKMSHKLDEAIPGAPLITPHKDVNFALSALKAAYLRFDKHQGPFQKHFAYGQLSKQQYELAHAMHFINHLSELSYQPI